MAEVEKYALKLS